MDFWQTLTVLLRRWYVAGPAFVASLVLAALAASFTPPTYESGSVLALTSPLTGGTTPVAADRPRALTNPLLGFDQSLSQTAALLIQEAKSPAVASSLGVRPGSGVEYVVNNGTSNPELLQSGPFIFITGRGSTAEDARSITDRVASSVVDTLATRQEELAAPPSTRITVQTVVGTTAPERLTGRPARVAVTSLALALLTSLMAVYAVESIATRSRQGGP